MCPFPTGVLALQWVNLHLLSTVVAVDDEIIGWLARRERQRKAMSAVPPKADIR